MTRINGHSLRLEAKKFVINLKFLSLFVIFVLLFIGLSLFPSYAAPQGGEVVAGDITITNPAEGQTLINQITQSGIINWQSFSIGSGEHTHFNQPSASSVTLNRVIGSDASHILGRLSATGIIMLVNQAGIFFGSNSVVDAAGLIATTSNIEDADFLQGTYRFLQIGNPTASIIAQGQINIAQEGIVALMAPGVENAGVITANLGKVVLASVAQGSSYVVDLYGDNLVHFSVRNELVSAPRNQNNQEMSAAVSNTGAIYADGGKILLTARVAKDIVHSVINTSGIIEANTVSERNGEIYLDAGDQGITRVSGTLHARGSEPGETGGTITVLGDVIAIAESDPAIIDVSGAAGGGNIFIGGGFQGGGDLPHSTITYISPEAQLLANALIEGKGGQIVAWSDYYTGVHGALEATGGIQGGNGGFIEISGKEYFNFDGSVDLSALNGNFGTLLLDPQNIIIESFGTVYNPGVNNLFANAPTMGVFMLNTSLDTGANIILQANTDITVNAPISLTTVGASLTMQAGRDIKIYDNITTNNGAINLTANDSNALSANRAVGTGDIIIGDVGNPQITINSQGGNINLTIGTSTTSPFDPGSIYIEKAQLLLNNAGTLTLSTPVDITIGDTSAPAYLNNASVMNITAGNDVLFQNASSITNPGTATITATSGAITLEKIDGAGDLVLNAGTVTNLTDVIGGTTPITSLTANAGGITQIGANITTTGNQTYNDAITLTGNAVLTGADFNPSTSITGGGNDLGLSFTAPMVISANTIEGISFSNLGTLTVSGAGGTSLTGTVNQAYSYVFNNAVTLAGATTLSSSGGSGDIIFDTSSTVNGANTLTLNTIGTTTISGEIGGITPITSLTTSVGGTTQIGANVTTTGDQTYNDAVTLTADVTLESTGGLGDDITFQSTIDGGYNLLVKAAEGTIRTQGDIGGGTPLITLIFNKTLTGDIYIGGDITTTGYQWYVGTEVNLTDHVILTGDTLQGGISSISGGGTKNLTLNFNHLDITNNLITTFLSLALIDINTLTIGGSGTDTVNLTGTIDEAISYVINSAVTLTGNARFTSSSSSGDIIFNTSSTVDGGNTLTLSTTGNTIIRGTIGGVTPITSLTTNAGGTTQIGASITTTGTQDYNDAIVLIASPILTTATGNIDFAGTIDGSFALTVASTSGDIIAGGAIGGGTGLTRIDFSTTSGSISLQDVNTLDHQAYAAAGITLNNGYDTNGGDFIVTGPVTLAGDTIIRADGGSINFNTVLSTIDSDAPLTPRNLVLDTSKEDINLQGELGGTYPLSQLTLTTSDGGVINVGGDIMASDGHTYAAPIVLNADSLISSKSGDIDFQSTITNAVGRILTVSSTGGNILAKGAIGGGTPLSAVSFTTNFLGTIEIRDNITTTGNQTYTTAATGNLTLGGVVGTKIFTSSGGTVNFATAIIGGTNNLDIQGNADFDRVVNGLGTLNVSGTSNIGADITSTGTQTYNDAVLLTENAALSGSGVNFQSTIDSQAGSYYGLSVTASGMDNLIINGAVGSGVNQELGYITLNAGGGDIRLGATIETTGAQTYVSPIILTAFSAFTSTTGDINVQSTVNGAFGLNMRTKAGGNIITGGAIGGVTPLTSMGFTIDAAGLIQLGGNVTTSGTQVYHGAMELIQNTALIGGSIDFNATIDSLAGFYYGLSVTTTVGGIHLFSPVGSGVNQELGYLTLNSGASNTSLETTIKTIGNQTYASNVVLADDSTLISTTGNVNFQSMITGGANNLIITANADFDGVVDGLGTLNVSGTSDIGADITTIGNQTYSNTISLTNNVVLTGAGFFPSTQIQGNNYNLTLNFSGDTNITNTTINAAPFTNIGAITTGGGGITNLSGAVINAFTSQTYNDTAVLLNNIILDTAASSGNVIIGGQISGAAWDLTIKAENTYGAINVGGLNLETNFALRSGTSNDGLTGFVGGESGILGARAINVLNTITAGTHFFDRIDLFNMSVSSLSFMPQQVLPGYYNLLGNSKYIDYIINQEMGPADLIIMQLSPERQYELIGDTITVYHSPFKLRN